MRHQKTRHKLSRDSAHRKALLANLCVEVIDHERIKTTQAKAKAVKPEIEKLITLARKGDLHARRQAISILQHPDKGVIYKLFEEIAPRYAARPGGYTRIVKLGPRRGDNAPMAIIELVEPLTVAQEATREAEAATKRAVKEAEAKTETPVVEDEAPAADEATEVETEAAAEVEDAKPESEEA